MYLLEEAPVGDDLELLEDEEDAPVDECLLQPLQLAVQLAQVSVLNFGRLIT